MVAGRRPTLLLADDSVATQKVVSLTFGDEGYEVTTVSDGQQALAFLRENAPPDIVLADCLMPGLNGYELCERIKTDTRWRHIPVLLLVGIFEPFNEAEARRVGADDVLTKPFQSIRDLMSKVGSMLGGGGKTEDEPPQPHTQRHEPPPPQPASPPRADHHAAESSAVASDDPFADLGTDDQMIEATPAEGFGTQEGQTRHAMHEHAEPFDDHDTFSRFPTGGADDREAPADRDTPDDIGEETLISHPVAATSAPAASVSTAGAFGRQMAGATAADDALLDLGDIEPPPSTVEADDFILDLSDESPAPSPVSEQPSLVSAQPSVAMDTADTASAFAEASHGESAAHAPLAFSPTIVETETTSGVEDAAVNLEATQGASETQEMRGAQPFIEPTVVASEAPLPIGMEGSRVNRGAEGDVARPPVQESHDADAGAGVFAPVAEDDDGARVSHGLITLEQLSPEVIDAIARRAVELLSERAVQEIAWEVVPQLAELIIKRRLDEK